MVFVWAADRQPEDERAAWIDSLTHPLPGESLEVADDSFDDSFHQIEQ